MKTILFFLSLMCISPYGFASEGEAPVDEADMEADAATSREAAAVDATEEDFADVVRGADAQTTVETPRSVETALEEDYEDDEKDPGDAVHEEADDASSHAAENTSALANLSLHIPAPSHALVSPELIKQAKELDKKKKKKKKKCATSKNQCKS